MSSISQHRATIPLLVTIVTAAPALHAQSKPPLASAVAKPAVAGVSAAANARATLTASNIAAFQQSLQISVDSTQWTTSAVMFSGCQGAPSPCDGGAAPRKVYLRWTQIAPAKQMTGVHQQSPAFTPPPYRVVSDSLPNICGVGMASPQPSAGRALDIHLAGQATRIPFVCEWRVIAEVPPGSPLVGQSTQVTTVQSNTVTLLVRGPAGRPPHGSR